MKAIKDINELPEKVSNAQNQSQRENFEKALQKAEEQFEKNEIYKELRSLNDQEIKIVEDLPKVKGERAEKNLFCSLKKYFQESNEEAMVFYSFEFMGLRNQKNMDVSEKDFIIVNFTNKYIMPLEAKTNFTNVTLKSAIKQIGDPLKGAKNVINNWVAGDLSRECGWKFVPAISFGNEIENIDEIFCTYCKKYIIHGNDMDQQLRQMFGQIEPNSCSDQQKAREKFKTLAEYFLFLATLEPLFTLGRLSEKIGDVVDKCGIGENVEMWRCWNPDQLPILKMEALRVLFFSAPSIFGSLHQAKPS